MPFTADSPAGIPMGVKPVQGHVGCVNQGQNPIDIYCWLLTLSLVFLLMTKRKTCRMCQSGPESCRHILLATDTVSGISIDDKAENIPYSN